MASPLLSDLGAETHQFHTGLLVVQYQTLHSSNAEGVFRFNLRHRPAESIAGHAVLLLSPPPRGIMGNVVISPCIMGTVVIFLFRPFPLQRLLRPAQIHPGRQFILSLHPSMISCPLSGPGSHGILGCVVPMSLAPLTPPPCGKADGRGTCREL